jgi:catechol 2,3-dioxygenase-like lactoylglutathione lyase family enzyme
MAIMPPVFHSHTTLETTDIDRAVRFYREVLGLSTGRQLERVGLLRATNDHICAIIELPRPSAQPYWNYYARPVPRDRVDAIHDAIVAVADAYEIAEVGLPLIETRYGIGSYGFSLCDRDGNWWRIEEADGPFGRAELPALEGTSIVPPGPIAYVTLESADLAATAAFYRDFLGLPVALRDGALHSPGRGGVNLIVVPAAGELLPQPVLNHHGLTLPEGDRAGVEAVHAALREHGERFGVRKTQKITEQHGSYAFYFQDRDTNWWEVETLLAGLNPWQRVSNEPGSSHLLDKTRGRNTILHPFRESAVAERL